MAVTGWYVLYRDGLGYSVRATDGFDAAIGTAWQLHREGRDVIQVGPRDQQRADEVISANEIKRIYARMERINHPARGIERGELVPGVQLLSARMLPKRMAEYELVSHW